MSKGSICGNDNRPAWLSTKVPPTLNLRKKWIIVWKSRFHCTYKVNYHGIPAIRSAHWRACKWPGLLHLLGLPLQRHSVESVPVRLWLTYQLPRGLLYFRSLLNPANHCISSRNTVHLFYGCISWSACLSISILAPLLAYMRGLIGKGYGRPVLKHQ